MMWWLPHWFRHCFVGTGHCPSDRHTDCIKRERSLRCIGVAWSRALDEKTKLYGHHIDDFSKWTASFDQRSDSCGYSKARQKETCFAGLAGLSSSALTCLVDTCASPLKACARPDQLPPRGNSISCCRAWWIAPCNPHTINPGANLASRHCWYLLPKKVPNLLNRFRKTTR